MPRVKKTKSAANFLFISVCSHNSHSLHPSPTLSVSAFLPLPHSRITRTLFCCSLCPASGSQQTVRVFGFDFDFIKSMTHPAVWQPSWPFALMCSPYPYPIARFPYLLFSSDFNPKLLLSVCLRHLTNCNCCQFAVADF